MAELMTARKVRAMEGIPTLEERRREYIPLNRCVVCGKPTDMMCRKHTGICSENCHKKYTTIKEKQNA